MLAAKHFDPVMGVDVHFVVIPPAGPVPIPHPHISMIIDPMDYIPVIGGTVMVGGIHRATAGTAGKPIPHIPMGGPFSKPPGNEDEIFMGSATVLADGAPFTFTALPCLSCQDIGMIAPVRAKKPKKSYGMVLPTSVIMPIPAGMPVLVGGAPTVDMMGLAMSGAFAALGPACKKLRAMQKKSGTFKKISKAIHDKAKKIMDKLGVPPNVRNKVHKSICTVTGHPVDVATGKMFTDHIDFELPGSIPLKWERTWFSSSVYQGPLGSGWHHNYDMLLAEEDRAVAVRLADGRAVAFPALKVGQESYDKNEQLTLSRFENGYLLQNKAGMQFHFSPHQSRDDYQLLRFITKRGLKLKVTFFYDDHAKLVGIIDSCNRKITLQHDAHGRIYKIFLPHPNNMGEKFCAVEYQYSLNDLVVAKDALQQALKYRYHNHLLVQETLKNGLSFYFQYDKYDLSGKCIRTWGDNGIYYRELTYYENSTTVVNSLGHKTHYEHNGILATKITDPKGACTELAYNEGFLLTRQVEPDGKETKYEYDERGNIVAIQYPSGKSMLAEYNAHDLVTKIEDVRGNVWLWSYDNEGRLHEQLSSSDNKTTYRYCEKGRLVSITESNTVVTSFDYTVNNELYYVTKGAKISSTYEVDFLGRVIKSEDSKGNKKLLKYDLLGRTTHVQDVDGSRRVIQYDEENNVTGIRDNHNCIGFTYCGLGRVKTRSLNGISIFFNYDTEEQLLEIANENASVYQFSYDSTGLLSSESGFDGILKKYERNKSGQVIQVCRPDNKFMSLDYDLIGRVSLVRYSDGDYEKYAYDEFGGLLKAETRDSIIQLEYDNLGRKIRETQGEHWVAYEYNSFGKRVKLMSSQGVNVAIQRNIEGHVSAINVDGDECQTTFLRDELGLELQRNLPGGIQSRWQRDKLGRPIQFDIVSDATLLHQSQYTWEIDCRLKEVSGGNKTHTKFHYDALGTLVSAHNQSGAVDLRLPDAVGNLYKTHQKNDRIYGAAGQLLFSRDKRLEIRYSYDAEGQLIQKIRSDGKKWQYFWNDRGFLKKVILPNGRTISYCYDAFGRRTQQITESAKKYWIWDGNNPLHEWVVSVGSNTNVTLGVGSEAQTQFKQNVILDQAQTRGPPKTSEGTEDAPITWYFEPETQKPFGKQVGGRFYSIITDHIGTPCKMVDDQGHVIWSAQISMWGDVQVLGEKQECPFRWPGQYEDLETGLYYNRFRYYDPDIGQYISQDPLGMLAGMQAYGYVADPNSATDPFGLLGVGDIHPQTGNEILAVAEEGDNIDYLVEGSKPSMQGKLVKEVYYENPGHHDPKGGAQPYNPKKSVLPDDHVELFKKSVPYNGARYAMDSNGNIHQFQDSVGRTYHWAGQEGGKTFKGKDVPLVVPKGVREMCRR